MHEFALAGITVSSLGGQTLNAYDLTRTPGGSSGGTAVTVTSNLAMAGTGSDTVNSIRSPASASALIGVRQHAIFAFAQPYAHRQFTSG
jgi:amidase